MFWDNVAWVYDLFANFINRKANRALCEAVAQMIQPEDEAIVPDGGSHDGAFVEVAEKSQVWLKFTVNGKTAHAAMPQLGINACYIGMKFGVELEETLKAVYSEEDPLFNPPMSTFELTQNFANVASPNVLPGKDIFCMDMRILPM